MRITKGDMGPIIEQSSEDYRFFNDQGVTVCLLVMPGGFCVTGESACPDPKRFDHEVGKKIAKKRAVDRLWQFERYRRFFRENP